jgi:hypothetical protein
VYEKHAVTTWNLNILKDRGNPRELVPITEVIFEIQILPQRIHPASLLKVAILSCDLVNTHCLFRELSETHKHTVWVK